MTDKMTAERLAEIREGLADFDRRRLETSMSGGVDTPGRVTYHFGPSPDGLPRYGIVGMLPEIATELLAEIDRLREHCADLMLSLTYSDHELEEHAVPEIERLRARNADLAMRLDMAVHEMEEHVAPERDRLREQVERLAAENADLRANFARYWSEVPRRWIEEGPTP